jgi:hypothetical protein
MDLFLRGSRIISDQDCSAYAYLDAYFDVCWTGFVLVLRRLLLGRFGITILRWAQLNSPRPFPSCISLSFAQRILRVVPPLDAYFDVDWARRLGKLVSFRRITITILATIPGAGWNRPDS